MKVQILNEARANEIRNQLNALVSKITELAKIVFN